MRKLKAKEIKQRRETHGISLNEAQRYFNYYCRITLKRKSFGLKETKKCQSLQRSFSTK